jgi:hypothetical protein
MIRVILPQHLRTLAHVTGEVTLDTQFRDNALRPRRA